MYHKYLTNGIFKQNPSLVLMLGLCPTLAVSTSAMNGLAMGIATAFVLLFSNLFISLLRNLIPERARILSFILIIATFVTVADLIMQAYFIRFHTALGIFIPLIVVNTFILSRAETVAKNNNPLISILDSLGMGIGFILAITILSCIREVLGSGSIFDIKLAADNAKTILFFILPPAGFITFGYMAALIQLKMKNIK